MVKASATSGWSTTSGRSTTPIRKDSAEAPRNGQAARGCAPKRRGAPKQAQMVPTPMTTKQTSGAMPRVYSSVASTPMPPKICHHRRPGVDGALDRTVIAPLAYVS
nr:hypothetical protein GCM10020092_043320 [Actinoplanes digitatis]